MMRATSVAILVVISWPLFADQAEEWVRALENPRYQRLALRPGNLQQKYLSHDLSVLFTPRMTFLGYIGNDFTKLAMTIESVTRDSIRPDTYKVIGRSKVGSNANMFEGTIRLMQVREYATLHYGVDDEFKDAGIRSEGLAIGSYTFKERTSLPNSGEFKGIVTAFWLVDKDGHLRYDDIEASFSDSYINNQYVGRWAPYGLSEQKPANWGEYRIPFSGDLDIGAAYFSPNPKYSTQGWADNAP